MTRAEIEALLPRIDAVGAMARAFAAYSAGRAIVPPVGEILFSEVDGEAHIKSGYIAGDALFVVKVATGFYRNAARGLPANSGALLVFSAVDGMVRAVLLDEGLLTNYRTAAAGALAAQYLAPGMVSKIGLLGSGVQARLQAELLRTVTPCRSVILWARRTDAARACAGDLEAAGFDVSVAATPAAVAAQANLIVSVTASRQALLTAADIRPGTHISAIGSDTPEKQELAPDLLARADIVVVDSRSQALERGELHHALAAYPRLADSALEIGAIASGKARGRTSDGQITIADLTGVAVQDVEIAKAVLDAIEKERA